MYASALFANTSIETSDTPEGLKKHVDAVTGFGLFECGDSGANKDKNVACRNELQESEVDPVEFTRKWGGEYFTGGKSVYIP